MQVSTRSQDFLVDVIKLRNHIGPALARCFSNAASLKVLHGSDRDIEWLQKDFSLYVVNMFDTGQAARLLGLAGGYGLKNLLSSCCGVQVRVPWQFRAAWSSSPSGIAGAKACFCVVLEHGMFAWHCKALSSHSFLAKLVLWLALVMSIVLHS